MNRRVTGARILRVAAAVVAVATVAVGAARVYDVFCRERTPEFVGDYRAIARDVPSGPVAMLCDDAGDVSPIERTKLAVLDWELFPDAVLPIEKSALAEWNGVVVDSVHVSNRRKMLFERASFVPLASNGSATVWGRRDKEAFRRPCGRGVSLAREFGGALAALALLVYSWVAARGGAFRFKVLDLSLAALAFAVLSAVSLKVGFSAPNGFAVYAGKAKLLLAAGGVPQGFWTSPEFAVCQPSYPPGMVFPAIVSFAVSGGFGESLLQLFVPLALALLFLEIVGEGPRSPIRSLIALSFVLSPLAMRMAAGYYAEPMAALLVAMGLNAVKRGRSMRGWALVGVAALFRLECLVLAAALLLCGGVCREPGKNDLKWWLRTALCLSPGVAWNVFAILHGAHVQGFDFFSFPSPHRICVASESAFASVLFLRNGLVPLCLVAIAVAISIVHGERILARKWLLACFAALLAGIAILGFNESAHYAWIVDNVMPRFVWLCALPLLVSDGHWFSGGTSPYLAYSRPH